MVLKTGALKVKTRSIPTRITSNPPSQEYNAAGVPQGSPFGGGNVTVFENSERIAYTTLPKSLRSRSNACDHVKITDYYSSPNCAHVTVRNKSPHHLDGWYVDYGTFHDNLVRASGKAFGYTGLGISESLPYPGNPLSDMNGVYNDLRPDLTELSLPNFLLELDDVQKFWKQYKRAAGLIRKAVRAQRIPKGSTGKQLAGGHLGYELGIKPLLSDLEAMSSILTSLIQKLRDFNDRCGKISTNRRTITNTVTTKSGTGNYAGLTTHPQRWTAVYELHKTAGLTYMPLPLEITGKYLPILRVLLDAVGFELNAAIVWDAVPFSFVVDWFFDIGSWLERHKHDTLELPIKYVDSYIQCTQDVNISSTLIYNVNDIITLFGRVTCPTWIHHKKRFMRIPVAPDELTFTSSGWSLPTLNQAKLLVSLGTVLK